MRRDAGSPRGGAGRRRRAPAAPLERQTLVSLIQRNPAVLEVLHDHGVHFCAGCYLTLSAPLHKAAAWHAVPDLERFLKDMQRALRSPRPLDR